MGLGIRIMLLVLGAAS